MNSATLPAAFARTWRNPTGRGHGPGRRPALNAPADPLGGAGRHQQRGGCGLASDEARYVTGVALPVDARHSHQIGPGRIAMSNRWFEDGGRGAAPCQKTAAEIGVLVDRGRLGAGHHAEGQRGGVRRNWGSPRARRGTARQAGNLATTVLGPAGVPWPVICSPDRGAGSASRRRGWRSPRAAAKPRHRRWG